MQEKVILSCVVIPSAVGTVQVAMQAVHLNELRVQVTPLCHNSGCTNPAPNKCAGCKVVRYCSKACQRAHWPTHKPICTKGKVEMASPSADAHETGGVINNAVRILPGPFSDRESLRRLVKPFARRPSRWAWTRRSSITCGNYVVSGFMVMCGLQLYIEFFSELQNFCVTAGSLRFLFCQFRKSSELESTQDDDQWRTSDSLYWS
jgi:hypothetical protein